MSDTELLPCPCCGAETRYKTVPNTVDGYPTAECSRCGLTMSKPTIERLTREWNKGVITLDQAKQVLAEAGMVAVSIEDCTHAANTMEVRNSVEEAAHHRFIDIDDAAQDKPDA